MSRYLGPKKKLERSLGVNLWGRPGSAFEKRNSRPGQHGASPRKLSDYAHQLQAKQRMRFYYGGINEKQFRKVYEEAIRTKGDTSKNMINLLASRLDAIVYSMKFAATIFAARQLVSHGHILVNGKRVNIPSYRVKAGDKIEVRQNMKEAKVILESLQLAEREVPIYLTVDDKQVAGTVERMGDLTIEDIAYPINLEPHLVVEFYSK